ncbi:MAG: hypothetical protein ABIH39_01910 [Candidatus Margulisiibacteriota bacterium]
MQSNKSVEQTPQSDQKLSEPVSEDTATDATREISGRIRSFNDKAVYIEIADGKGFAANINSETPVMTEGITEPGTLVKLKPGQNITVKVDNFNTAIEILIKK